MPEQPYNPALAVACPYEGGCGAPAGTPCYSSYEGTTHAERVRIAELRSLDQGTCGLCGKLLVRGSVGGGPVEVWHPYPADQTCPPLPDPATDWNSYALAIQQGLAPGRPGAEHFIRVHGSGGYDDPDAPRVYAGTGPLAGTPVDEAELDARIEALHGPGAVAAIEDAFADGSIFAESHRPVLCPECASGKHVNCDQRAMHPVTDEMVACDCTHGAPA